MAHYRGRANSVSGTYFYTLIWVRIMKIRFDSFKHFRTVEKLQGGKTTRVEVETPHHAMISDLDYNDLLEIKDRCEQLLFNPKLERIIYLHNIITIEEVTNE